MLTRDYDSTNFITGLRAIAMLMVFLIHSGGGGLRDILNFGNRIVDLGKYGVEIFFVISGFTIFYQFYNRRYTWQTFLIVRLARVSLPYFPVIIGIFLLSFYGNYFFNSWADKFNDGEITLLNLFLHLSYLSYFDIKYANTIIGVEWTLAIEVFYYLLLGLMIFKIKDLSKIRGALFYFLVFLLVSFTCVLLSKINQTESKALLISWLPFKYGYMFLLGGLSYHLRMLYLKKNTHTLINKLSDRMIIFSFISIMFFLININIPDIGFLNEFVFAIITFLLIIFVSDSSYLSRLFTNKIMIFIGSISYSFYLLHMLILNTPFLKSDIESAPLNFLYSLFLTICISTLYYYVFEVKLYGNFKMYIFRKKTSS